MPAPGRTAGTNDGEDTQNRAADFVIGRLPNLMRARTGAPQPRRADRITSGSATVSPVTAAPSRLKAIRTDGTPDG